MKTYLALPLAMCFWQEHPHAYRGNQRRQDKGEKRDMPVVDACQTGTPDTGEESAEYETTGIYVL